MLSAVIRSKRDYSAFTVGTITDTSGVYPKKSSRTIFGSSQYSSANTGYGPNCFTHEGLEFSLFILNTPLSFDKARTMSSPCSYFRIYRGWRIIPMQLWISLLGNVVKTHVLVRSLYGDFSKTISIFYKPQQFFDK